MNMFLRAFAVTSLILFSAWSMAAMQISKSIIDYQPGDPSRQDIEISNPDAEPLYIKVEIKQIVNPGMENEKIVVVTNPKESGLLATPNRLVIPPGATKMVRVVNLKGLTDKERIFRVALTPVPADIEAETTGVKILVGYQLLVLIQPIAPKPDVVATRAEGKLTLVNNGNTNVLFSAGKQCATAKVDDKKADDKEATEDCVELTAFRLYAGNTHVVDLKHGERPIEFRQSIGTTSQMVVY